MKADEEAIKDILYQHKLHPRHKKGECIRVIAATESLLALIRQARISELERLEKTLNPAPDDFTIQDRIKELHNGKKK